VLSAAPLVGELLNAAPRLKVLATSRIPLGIYVEHEYGVPPLALPDPRKLPDLGTLSQYEAIRLFIERAEAAKAGFEITNDNAPAVAEISARLDGLPLAIELAAARMKLLTGGAKDLPARQRTLRGAMEWSHDLLEEGERTLFARLAVFSGGRTLEAIAAVCDAEGDLPVDALDGVGSSQWKQCSISWANYWAWIATKHWHSPASPWTSVLPRWSTVQEACMPCCHTARSDKGLEFRAGTAWVRRLRVPRRSSVARGECRGSQAHSWLRSAHSP
jgi:hypothetical protein